MRGIFSPVEKDVIVIKDDKQKIIDKTVDKIENIFIELIKRVDKIQLDGKSKDENIKLKILSELVVGIFNFPMMIGYVNLSESKANEGRNEPILNSFNYLITYVLKRHLDPDLSGKIYSALKKTDLSEGENSLENVLNLITGKEGNSSENRALNDILSYIYSKEFRESLAEIYESLKNVPADTRPGYNLSSVLSHMTLTSLIAWGIQEDSYDLPAIRLAAVLHDIGKVKNYKEHVKGTNEFFNNILNKVKNDIHNDFLNQLEQAREKASSHHQGGGYLDEADDLAASIDRLSDLVKDILNNDQGVKRWLQETGKSKLPECYNKPRQYDCFDKLTENEYKELTTMLYDKLYNRISSKSEKTKTAQTKGSPVLTLMYIDFLGIQKFISSFPKLKDMSTASFLVDFLVSTLPFIVIDYLITQKGKNNYLPLEALLSGYGGHAMIAFRSYENLAEEVKKEILSLDLLSTLDVSLGVYHTPMIVKDVKYKSVRYDEIWEHLKEQMMDRSKVRWEERAYSYEPKEICSNCGLRPAVKRDDKLCTRCAAVRSISNLKGFHNKVRATYVVGDTVLTPQNCFSGEVDEYAMEFISGYNKPPEDNSNEDVINPPFIGVLKFDANDASKVYSRVITYGMYLDLSYSMDYAIKQGFYESLKDLVSIDSNKVGEHLAARILSGVMYLGGDEGLVFMPGIISVPFSLSFIKKISEKSKFKFKGGLVLIKPKHPVQFAIESVEEVMEKAKIGGEKSENSLGIALTSSIITPESFDTTLNLYKSILRVKNKLEGDDEINLRKAVKLILNVGDHQTPEEETREIYKAVGELYSSLLNKAPAKGVNEERVEHVMDVIRTLEDLVSQYFRSKGGDPKFLIVYMIRERARNEDEKVRSLMELLLRDAKARNCLTKQEECNFPLLDMLNVSKSFRGGLRR